MPVDWGGDTEVLEVSATKGTGLDNLLETMSLQAEVLELKRQSEGADARHGHRVPHGSGPRPDGDRHRADRHASRSASPSSAAHARAR